MATLEKLRPRTGFDLDISIPVTVESTGDERFRIYELGRCDRCRELRPNPPLRSCPTCGGKGTALRLLATTGTKEGVGVALITLAEDALEAGAIVPGPIGILDGETRHWLALPWARR